MRPLSFHRVLMLLSLPLLARMPAAAQGSFFLTFGGSQLDYSHAMTMAPGNAYISTGPTRSLSGSNDVYLMKLDINGNAAWVRTYGSPGNEGTQGLARTTDGGFAIGAYSNGFGGGTFDLYLIKTNSNGVFQWSRVLASPQNDQLSETMETSDQGILMVGTTAVSNNDMWLVKYSATGTLLWSKRYDLGMHESGFGITELPDGTLLMCGATMPDFFGTTDNAVLMRLDAMGNVIWSNVYAGAGAEMGFDVIRGLDGNLYMGGYTTSFGAGSRDMFLMQLGVSGAVNWTRTYGGPGMEFGGYNVVQTSDGGFALGGNTTSFGAGAQDFLLLKTNAGGTLQWARTYGGPSSDYGYEIIEAAPNEFVIHGNTQSFGMGNWDMLIIKTGANGVIGCNSSTVSPVSTSPSFTATPTAATVSNHGTELAHTTITGTGSFTRMAICQVLPILVTHFQGERQEPGVQLTWGSSTWTDHLVFEIQRSGDGEWFETIGHVDAAPAPAEYAFHDPVEVSGTVFYRLHILGANGSEDYSETISLSSEFSSAMRLWPNPCDGICHLNLDEVEASVEVMDMQGRELHSISLTQSAGKATLDLSHLPKGVYWVEIQTHHHASRQLLMLK